MYACAYSRVHVCLRFVFQHFWVIVRGVYGGATHALATVMSIHQVFETFRNKLHDADLSKCAMTLICMFYFCFGYDVIF